MGLFRRIFFMFSHCSLPIPFPIRGRRFRATPLLPPLITPKNPYLIRQITFEGIEHLDRKQLSKLIGVEAGQPYFPAEIISGLNRVLEKYRESGIRICIN